MSELFDRYAKEYAKEAVAEAKAEAKAEDAYKFSKALGISLEKVCGIIGITVDDCKKAGIPVDN